MATVRDLSELETKINTELIALLALPSDSRPLRLEYADSKFVFDLNIGYGISAAVPLALNLADYDPTGALDGMGLSVKSGGDLQLDAAATLNVEFGFDLSNVFDPSYYISDVNRNRPDARHLQLDTTQLSSHDRSAGHG